jgi:DNA-binding transcriptional MerR regulator
MRPSELGLNWSTSMATEPDLFAAAEADSTSPPSPADEGFSGRRAAELVGISYRQLDYWARTDLVRPSLADATGSGSRRRYSYRDLLELKVIKMLLDAGMRLENVRQVFSYLRDELGEDIASAQLVIDGSHPVLVRDDSELIDLLRQGQGVLQLVPLAGVVREMDATILRFRRGESDASAPAAPPVEIAPAVGEV